MSTEGLGRRLRLGMALALVFLACAFFYRAADSGYQQGVAPFSLDAGEFSNLESIKVIRAGENPYSAEIYGAPPFVFTGYTPIYHYVVALLPMPDENPFLWGRVVAAVSMLLVGLLPFLVVARSGLGVAGVAMGVFFALAPVAYRAVLIRNDSLGLLLTGLSICLVHRAAGRFGWLFVAVGLSVLSVFVKQVFFAAPIACAIWLFYTDRSSFYRFMGAGLGISLVVVVFVQIVWGSGFWFATIMGPQHPMMWQNGLAVASLVLLREPLAIALVGVALLVGLLSAREKGRQALLESPYLLYVLTSTAVLVATVGKLGSGTNYFIEPFLAILLWLTYLVSRSERPYLRNPLVVSLAVLVVLAECLQFILVPAPMFPSARPEKAKQVIANLERERQDIESLGIENPSVLGLLHHPGLYRESDDVHLSYPLFYLQLWHDELLDLDDLIAHVENSEFDIIVAPRGWWEGPRSIEPDAGLTWREIMHGPKRLMEAVESHYQVGSERGDTLYLVRESSRLPSLE